MPIALRFPIALVLLIVCLATPTWADFQAGVEAYDRDDYATALSEWRPLAEKGVAEARTFATPFVFVSIVSTEYAVLQPTPPQKSPQSLVPVYGPPQVLTVRLHPSLTRECSPSAVF